MSEAPYGLVLTPPAIRAVRSALPEAVAAAVIEFLTGALVENPHRVGKQLRGDLAGIGSARRGTYRVLYRINEYRINEVEHDVVVLRIPCRNGASAGVPWIHRAGGSDSGVPRTAREAGSASALVMTYDAIVLPPAR